MVVLELVWFSVFVFVMISFVILKWESYLMIVMGMEFVHFLMFYLVAFFAGLAYFVDVLFYYFLVFVVGTVSSLVFLIYLVRGSGNDMVSFYN